MKLPSQRLDQAVITGVVPFDCFASMSDYRLRRMHISIFPRIPLLFEGKKGSSGKDYLG
jgi:hypothetical protein